MPITISIEADTPDELSKWVGHLAPLGLPMVITASAATVAGVNAAPAPQAAAPATSTTVNTAAGATGEGDEGGTDSAEDTRPMRGKNAQAAHDRIIAAIQAAPDEAALRALIMAEQNTMGRLPQDKRSSINAATNAKQASFAPAPAPAATTQAAAPAAAAPATAVKEYVVRDVEGMIVGTLVAPDEAVSLLADISDQQCQGGKNVAELLAQNADMIRSLPDAQKAECKEIFDEYVNPKGGEAAPAAAPAGADPTPAVMREKFQALVEKVAFNDAVAVLKRFGATKLSELDSAEKRAGFVAAVETALAA